MHMMNKSCICLQNYTCKQRDRERERERDENENENENENESVIDTCIISQTRPLVERSQSCRRGNVA